MTKTLMMVTGVTLHVKKNSSQSAHTIHITLYQLEDPAEVIENLSLTKRKTEKMETEAVMMGETAHVNQNQVIS